jgi:hypothetical protein
MLSHVVPPAFRKRLAEPLFGQEAMLMLVDRLVNPVRVELDARAEVYDDPGAVDRRFERRRSSQQAMGAA